MEPSLQRRVQRYGWDKAALYYEEFWHRQLQPAQDCLLEMAALKKEDHVLDIACGTGLVSFRAKEIVGDTGFVKGTDISDKMIEMSAAIAKEKNLLNIEFERMDAEELNISSETFDVALCALGLMYMPAPVGALKEMHRVLKPGGHAVAAVWGARDHCGWAEIFEIVDKRVASEVCPMFFNPGNPGMLELLMKTAGFTSISVKKISTILYYSSGAEACGAAFAGGPVALAYNKFTDDIKNEVHGEYLDSIQKYKTGETYNVPGEFVVASGYKN